MIKKDYLDRIFQCKNCQHPKLIGFTLSDTAPSRSLILKLKCGYCKKFAWFNQVVN